MDVEGALPGVQSDEGTGVKANRVPDDTRFFDMKPHDYKFLRTRPSQDAEVTHICICCGKCGAPNILPVLPEHAVHWHWDGHEDNPTLLPSILHKGNDVVPCDWHVHLKAGEFVSC